MGVKNYLRGVAKVLEIAPPPRLTRKLRPRQADGMVVIRSDWGKIGRDFSKVIEKYPFNARQLTNAGVGKYVGYTFESRDPTRCAKR
jgi:hypothetical protein